MRVTSFVAHRTGKIVKNDLSVFERGKYLLQNVSQSSEIALESWKEYEKPTFPKEIWYLKDPF